jgi:transcriptional regulator with XRE-family HTH domain
MRRIGEDVAVVPRATSPTVRRRELGIALRDLRLSKGLTVEQVAEVLLCSSSKVSRMETGQRAATVRDVRDLCDFYEVADATERDRLMNLAKEAKQPGWWQSYALPYSNYVGLEEDATSIKVYDSAVIPGLFQTAEYAQVLQEAPIPKQEPEVIEKWVRARVTRQQILTRDHPPNLQVVLDEAVFHRVIGSATIMHAQLMRVVEATGMPSVTVQVIPYSVGAHPALDSVFTILEFESSVPDVVYVEGLVGHLYLDHARDLERYGHVFDRLRSMALNVEESKEFIVKSAHNYEPKRGSLISAVLERVSKARSLKPV